MDNLTHSLVGAALSRAGLDRRTPLATATLVLAANAPDIDVLSYMRGQWFALSFRRGVTHGVPAMVLLPFAVAAVMLVWDRAVRRRMDSEAPPALFAPLLALSFVGVLTHPVLDWMNTYGMRWWLPFDGRWSYGDSLFIVDPWLWLMLGAAAVLAGPRSRVVAFFWIGLAAVTTRLVFTSGLVPRAGEILWAVGVAAVAGAWLLGRPASDPARAGLARVLTVAAALYIGAMVITHHTAAGDVRAVLQGGQAGEGDQVVIAPLPALPLRSDVLVSTGAGYLLGTHDWTASPTVALDLEGGFLRVSVDPDVPEEEAFAAVSAARLNADVAHYLVWSRFPYWTVEHAEGGYAVRVGDARYTGRGGGLSGLTVTVGPGP